MSNIYHEWKCMVQNHHEAWYSMLRAYCNDKSQFVRDFATKHGRYLVRNIHELYDQILRHGYEFNRNLYISVYEYGDVKDKLPVYSSHKYLDKVVFDIDLDQPYELKEGFELCHDIIGAIRDERGPFKKARDRSRIFYTGNGFHVYYIPANPFKKNRTKKEFCDKVYYKVGQDDMIDKALFADVARDIRIPYTIHPKTERQMIPVEDTLDETIEKSSQVNIPETPLFS